MRCGRFMDYAELPLPPALEGLVAAIWTAQVPADGAEWVALEAVPDGCVELIRRHSGQSFWRAEQPPLFAAGIASEPPRLRLGAGSRFTGIKFWPWGWHALGGATCAGFMDDWVAIDDPALAALIGDDAEEVPARLVSAFSGCPVPRLGIATLRGGSVADTAEHAGLSLRQLQRHFAEEIGLPPRAYLRLLRLQGAMAEIRASSDPLADTAAHQGYADQAHMARDFRQLAGLPPSAARARVKGPFV